MDHTASWIDPILKYMVDGLAPDNKVEAWRLQLRSALYTTMNGKLYRKGHCFPNLKCVTPEDDHKIMKDIHAGVCGNHAGARSLAHKTLRAGYFWTIMSALAQTISSSCHKCQMYANIPRAPPIALSILLAPWPFCQWGLDLIGKLPTAVGQFKYAIVAVDYQTKWVEAEPLVAITKEKVKNFLWKNIYCRFGVPDTIVIDNGTQFNNDELRAYTENLGTRILYASPAHPQTNEMLWAIRTMATEATGEIPFCMAFGSEVVLPIETQIQSPRIEYFDTGTNSEGLQLDADLLKERRDVAHMHNLANKQRIARYYDAKVQSQTLKLGDWVMKQVYPEPRGLDLSWTSPYEIVEEVGPATFYIRDMNAVVSRHPWNTQRLFYYYK
ncbi:protein NYNRIN-like [Rosa chinensis]|uniref:protein NYNRIN-like n=1 Tax=Rosa chinensis TaxID=74649 RepID=UPI000D08E4C8|nr:protein NYNRIN-like [Rosa chinensis]